MKFARAAAVVLTAIIYFVIKDQLFMRTSASASDKQEYHYVVRVIDGDTLKISAKEKVRLIGVDTPEKYYSDKLVSDARKAGKDTKSIQALGEKATKFTEDLCINRKVRLEFDSKDRDRYKRLLAYAYLEDGTFVNAKILEEGYGRAMIIPPNVKYADVFRRLEKEAKDAKKGLWKFY